jgi:hypothetical protein
MNCRRSALKPFDPDLTNGEGMSDLRYHSDVRAHINVGFEVNAVCADQPGKLAKLLGIACKLQMVWHRRAGRLADQQARRLFKSR